MTPEQETVLLIKGAITELPVEQAKAVEVLAETFRKAINDAEQPIGLMALALVGAEAQAGALS